MHRLNPLSLWHLTAFWWDSHFFYHVQQLYHSCWCKGLIRKAEAFEESHDFTTSTSFSRHNVVSLSVIVAATRQVMHSVKWHSSFCFTWWGRLARYPPQRWISPDLIQWSILDGIFLRTDPSIIDLCICVINPSIQFSIDFLPITVQKPASLHGNPRCQIHPFTLALYLSSSVF